MTLSVLSVIAGLLLLFGGGEVLVRGSVQLAERMGVSPLIIGLVVIGFGTSMPELVTSLQAAIDGTPDVAWGNIVGSNISNSVFILGAATLAAPIVLDANGLKRDAAFGFAISILLWLLAVSGLISVMTGIALICLLFAYLGYAYYEETHDAPTHGAAYDKGAAHSITLPETNLEATGWTKPVLMTVAGLVLLILGGKLLVSGAVTIATYIGLSQAVIGLTIVAIGTSLPEMITSVIAAWRGEGEIALGNIAGSNIYNILGIGGATAIASPGPLPTAVVGFDVPILLATSLTLLLIISTRKIIGRMSGAILLAAYAAYLALTIANST
ncbi:calcium/sodium antiporter [Sphingorhabdus sp. Alg239-R122]|uniref:calcium/sodium antiporter n=1 Tax=Sphingorhabdus sp. Alg239-R122 TaxID=2305989 RepID=UPI0013DC1140|nr:calcium/sodium antiporter [Sphingorhabdus sp. Alg239-R122]